MSAPSGQAPAVKALNCPGCGATVTIRGLERTLSVVCESCHSILDAKHPSLRVLQKFEGQQHIQPLIPLGARGKLHGDVYEVIGFQVRTIHVEGVAYSWAEYLLFNPYKGFRYLTEYQGHWNDVKAVRSVPEVTQTGGKPAVRFLGETYKHFQTGRAETTYVLGEFPWQVRVGDDVTVMDFVAPPRMLSSETTEDEVTWSLGEYLPGGRVWEAFQLPGRPPGAMGVFSNQPSPFKPKTRSMWAVALLLLAALFALSQLLAVVSRNEEVFSGRYSFQAGAAEGSYVTDIFPLKGRTSNVELSIRTDLSNNWAFFNLALINEQTGEAYDFGREVSYYFGRDSDGSWSEGKPGDSVYIPAVPPGRYYLRVEPEMAPSARSMDYTLTLRRDVPQFSFFWFAALFVVVPPILYTLRALTFEHARWQESDYASSGEGKDDE